MNRLPIVLIILMLLCAFGCNNPKSEATDEIEMEDNLYCEEDTLYPCGYSNIAYHFFPDTFLVSHKDILYFVNRLTCSARYNTIDSMIKWYNDVKNLSEQNISIQAMGLDSTLSIVEKQILPLEEEFGHYCTLARVDAAYRISDIWLFRTLDNYSKLISSVNSDDLKTAIKNEMKDWWAFMLLLYDEISIRIGHYGGSDIGEAIGDTYSYILECRANQLQNDYITVISTKRTSMDFMIVRAYFFDIDTYLFDSLWRCRPVQDCNNHFDSLAVVDYLDYLNDLKTLREKLISWIESRQLVNELLLDKRKYQNNTIKLLGELTNIDLHFQPEKYNL